MTSYYNIHEYLIKKTKTNKCNNIILKLNIFSIYNM